MTRLTAEFLRLESKARPFPTIILNVRVHNPSRMKLVILGLSGVAKIPGKVEIALPNLSPEDWGTEIPPGESSEVKVVLPLDLARLDLIEEVRKGADLTIEIECRAFNAYFHERVLEGFSNDEVDIQHEEYHISHAVVIAQSKWVGHLKDLGYGITKIVELPMPKPPAEADVKTALEYWEKARSAFTEGEYNLVFQQCRNAYEEIAKPLGGPSLRDLETLLKDKDKVARIKGAFSEGRFYHFLSMAEHPPSGEETVPREITRRDAELALSVTGALIVYFSKLLSQR